jgi:predicted Co/Zn/Cd cation transporter (cation efflux family)
MFVASFAIVSGLWALVAGRNQVPLVWAVVLAFLISGVASYRLLNGQREALARRVGERAENATRRFEELKAKEDHDED